MDDQNFSPRSCCFGKQFLDLMVHSAAGYVLTLALPPTFFKSFPRQVKLKGSIHFFLEKSWKFPQLEMIKKLIFSADKSYKKKLAYYKSLLNISKEFSFHFFTRPTSTIFLFHPLKSSFSCKQERPTSAIMMIRFEKNDGLQNHRNATVIKMCEWRA